MSIFINDLFSPLFHSFLVVIFTILKAVAYLILYIKITDWWNALLVARGAELLSRPYTGGGGLLGGLTPTPKCLSDSLKCNKNEYNFFFF